MKQLRICSLMMVATASVSMAFCMFFLSVPNAYADGAYVQSPSVYNRTSGQDGSTINSGKLYVTPSQVEQTKMLRAQPPKPQPQAIDEQGRPKIAGSEVAGSEKESKNKFDVYKTTLKQAGADKGGEAEPKIDLTNPYGDLFKTLKAASPQELFQRKKENITGIQTLSSQKVSGSAALGQHKSSMSVEDIRRQQEEIERKRQELANASVIAPEKTEAEIRAENKAIRDKMVQAKLSGLHRSLTHTQMNSVQTSSKTIAQQTKPVAPVEKTGLFGR